MSPGRSEGCLTVVGDYQMGRSSQGVTLHCPLPNPFRHQWVTVRDRFRSNLKWHFVWFALKKLWTRANQVSSNSIPPELCLCSPRDCWEQDAHSPGDILTNGRTILQQTNVLDAYIHKAFSKEKKFYHHSNCESKIVLISP